MTAPRSRCAPSPLWGGSRPSCRPTVAPNGERQAGLRRDGLAIGRLPTPGAGAVAALDHALLVDLGADLAVAGEQRLGRTHLRAERQLALGQPIGAVLHVLGFGAVLLRAARAIRAFVHLAARAEVADLGILRCP